MTESSLEPIGNVLLKTTLEVAKPDPKLKIVGTQVKNGKAYFLWNDQRVSSAAMSEDRDLEQIKTIQQKALPFTPFLSAEEKQKLTWEEQKTA